jgi:hypothetical protein
MGPPNSGFPAISPAKPAILQRQFTADGLTTVSRIVTLAREADAGRSDADGRRNSTERGLTECR